MMKRIYLCVWVSFAGAIAGATESVVDFNREVRPILSGNCFTCHGPDEEAREAGLRLDVASGATAARRGGEQAIVPGNPEASLLITAITEEDPFFRMPPASTGKTLSEGEIDTLRRWIAQGAAYDTHWSFKRVERPEVPATQHEGWVRNPVDAFIARRLDEEGLVPSPEAHPVTLVRRVWLDLTGLPPSRAEVDTFLRDTQPGAYARMVDRALASPHYGERWARVWLDLARYADTKGYEKDDRRTIWRYRDWVIDALNEDMPHDQFTREQIAGDLLPEPTLQQRIATAFHRNTMTNDEGGTDDEEFRAAAVVDRVNTTMTTWMGLTMACAQCHTHKYDPITHEEYFRFYAFFNQTADADRPDEAPTLPTPTPEQQAKLDGIDAEVSVLRAEARGALPDFEAALDTWVENQRALGHQAAPSSVWHVAGPFPAESFEAGHATVYLPEAGEIDLTATYEPGGIGWTLHEEWADGEVHDLPGEGGLAVTYLYRTVEVDRGRPVKILLGSNDSVKLWVNGRLVHEYAEPRSAAVDQDQAEVRLRAGINRILMKVTNAGGAHAFAFRMETEATPPAFLAALEKDRGARSEEDIRVLENAFMAQEPRLFTTQFRLNRLEKDRARIMKDVPTTPVMQELPEDQRRATHIHERGSFLSPGKAVEPGVPEALHPFPEGASANRLGLAQWLTSRENPLTARVAVNRFWEQIFGIGLVDTSEDFGLQGNMPSHPALLDWLAAEFMESGWRAKHLLRLLVTSATYRQEARVTPALLEQDPQNRLLARGPRFRLSAETIRDQALAVSGLLNGALHGPPVMPHQPEGVWEVVYSGDQWKTSADTEKYRRGLYTFWRRTAPYPSMTAFDAPSGEVCTVSRIRTNTPLQALVTLNDPVYVEAAQALARRVLEERPGSAASGLTHAFERALLRRPMEDEIPPLLELLESERAHYSSNPEAALSMATEPMGALPEGITPEEAAAWTVVCNVILNLDEFLTKR
jgi:mono/diheme cytochrome c family protein